MVLLGNLPFGYVLSELCVRVGVEGLPSGSILLTGFHQAASLIEECEAEEAFFHANMLYTPGLDGAHLIQVKLFSRAVNPSH